MSLRRRVYRLTWKIILSRFDDRSLSFNGRESNLDESSALHNSNTVVPCQQIWVLLKPSKPRLWSARCFYPRVLRMRLCWTDSPLPSFPTNNPGSIHSTHVLIAKEFFPALMPFPILKAGAYLQYLRKYFSRRFNLGLPTLQSTVWFLLQRQRFLLRSGKKIKSDQYASKKLNLIASREKSISTPGYNF